MGPGIVILFWGVIAGVGAFVWLGGLVLLIIGRKRKSRFLQWVGGAPFVLITIVSVITAATFSYFLVRASVPSYVYEDTFHQKPPSDVKEIKSNTWSFADSAHVYLKFRTTYKTFKDTLPKNLARVSYSEYQEKMTVLADESTPPWWNSPNERTSEIYILSTDFGKGKTFASETILMTYDAETQTAEYYYLGID
jgi:hypothetical protein